LATGSREAAAVFVEAQSALQPQISLLHEFGKGFAENTNKYAKMGRNFTFSRKKGLLSFVVQQEDEGLLAFFITVGYVNVKDENGRNPLVWARPISTQRITMVGRRCHMPPRAGTRRSSSCFSRQVRPTST
jgi:hypothetical protein